MSAVACAVVGGAIIGGVISADASRKAANTQADAISQAQAITLTAAEKARIEILDRVTPAMETYGRALKEVEGQIADGTLDVMNLLQQTSGNAQQRLTQAGADAKKAILGSTASSAGISTAGFENQYNRIQALPANQQQAAMVNLTKAIGSRVAETTGQPPEVIIQDMSASLGVPIEMTEVSPGQYEPAQATTEEGMRSATGVRNNAIMGPVFQATTGALAQTAPEQAAPEQAAPEQLPAPTGVPTYERTTIPNIDMSLPTTQAVASQAAPGTGYYGAIEAINTGEERGLQTLTQGAAAGRQDLLTGKTNAIDALNAAKTESLDRLNPYSSAGQAALDQEAALSGALGPEAQQAAINAFIESPGQKYLREREEQALLRNSAAIGGLGGGRIRSAIMEQALNIAATQQQSHLENLRSLATRGQTADEAASNVIQGTGANIANIEATTASQLSQLANSLGINVSQLLNTNATQRAQLAQQAGLDVAQVETTMGQLAAAYTAQFGQGIATAKATGIGDIANLSEQSATNRYIGEQNLATTLANLATNTASTVAEYEANKGSALAAGQMAQGQAYADAAKSIGSYAAYNMA